MWTVSEISAKMIKNTILAEKKNMSYIQRHLEQVVRSCSQTWPVLLLTGPRQAGKTTMLSKLAEAEGRSRAYVSLDDLAARDLAKNDPGLFLQLHKPPILIDEVQYAPELFAHIKLRVDKEYAPGSFWLTGSQVFRLMDGVQESLAGRVALLQLLPLSQREIACAPSQPFVPDLDSLLALQQGSGTWQAGAQAADAAAIFARVWNGSMPAMASGLHKERGIFYSSYISSYIERDVRELSGRVDALKFMRFVTSAAARVGQLVNFRSMAQDADIRETTARDWLNILECLGIVFLLHPYANNVLKRTIKTPKLYFHDTGLVCHLTRWSSPEVASLGAMSGALLENFVVSEIVKGYHNSGQQPYLHYYRDRDDREIDLLLERDGKLFPVEIKKTAMPDKRIPSGFRVIDKAPLERGTGAVICLAERPSAFDRQNLIVPVWMV